MMIALRFLLASLVLLSATTVAALAEPWKPLYERVDPVLQARLEARLQANPEWARLIAFREYAP